MTRLLIIFFGLLTFGLGCKTKKGEIVSTTQDNIEPVSSDKEDTVLFIDISKNEAESILSDFALSTNGFKDSLKVVKLFAIKDDTVLLDKNELREIKYDVNLDPYEAAYVYKGDTLILSNECSGTELICYREGLRILYDYGFDCVESCSSDKMRYYYLNNRILVYEDNFNEDCMLANQNTGIKSIRNEKFFVNLTKDLIGLERKTITTRNDFDTIKISRTSTIRTIDKDVVKKLLATLCL